MVIFGPSGADFGQKAWVAAFTLASGAPLWKFNLIPDPGEPGAASWTNPAALKNGGGSIWTPLALDASDGRQLYSFNTGGSIGGRVVSYAFDGTQYVAATSGTVSAFFGGSGPSAVVIFALGPSTTAH